MQKDIQLPNPITIIGTSLAFVAGLSWNDAIQSGIKDYYPQSKETTAKIVYAIIITILVIIFTFFLKYVNDLATNTVAKAMEYKKTLDISGQYA